MRHCCELEASLPGSFLTFPSIYPPRAAGFALSNLPETSNLDLAQEVVSALMGLLAPAFHKADAQPGKALSFPRASVEVPVLAALHTLGYSHGVDL